MKHLGIDGDATATLEVATIVTVGAQRWVTVTTAALQTATGLSRTLCRRSLNMACNLDASWGSFWPIQNANFDNKRQSVSSRGAHLPDQPSTVRRVTLASVRRDRDERARWLLCEALVTSPHKRTHLVLL
jgi:hypothetical protein